MNYFSSVCRTSASGHPRLRRKRARRWTCRIEAIDKSNLQAEVLAPVTLDDAGWLELMDMLGVAAGGAQRDTEREGVKHADQHLV